jgi:hypothetical protein
VKAVIGDIHGRDFWKGVLENPNFTDVYCTGDYWDSYEEPYRVQRRNFIELIEAAKKGRLHLCIGNHDLHYIAEGERYSGFQDNHCGAIRPLILGALPWLKVAYQADGWIISHAGFSKTFMRETGCTSLEAVQEKFNHNFHFLGFDRRCEDPYGNDSSQGPLWIRPPALVPEPFFDRQIIGHTPTEHITTLQTGKGQVILVDTEDKREVFEF